MANTFRGTFRRWMPIPDQHGGSPVGGHPAHTRPTGRFHRERDESSRMFAFGIKKSVPLQSRTRGRQPLAIPPTLNHLRAPPNSGATAIKRPTAATLSLMPGIHRAEWRSKRPSATPRTPTLFQWNRARCAGVKNSHREVEKLESLDAAMRQRQQKSPDQMKDRKRHFLATS